METSHKNNAKIFKALCDEQRLKILDLLRTGKKCGCELLENVEIGQSSLSYHMKILVESGIVESEQHGKWVHYNISETGSLLAIKILKEITSVEKL